MQHIDGRGGRFVTVLPRIRKEERFLRDWLQDNLPDWSEAQRKPGRRKDDPAAVWWTTSAPIPTAEGYPITLVRSSLKRTRDRESRAQKIERGMKALQDLAERLAGPRCRLKSTRRSSRPPAPRSQRPALSAGSASA